MFETQSFGESILSFVSSYKFYAPIITLVIAIILIRISKGIISRLINKESKSIEVKRKNTIIRLLDNIIKYAIWIIVFLVTLSLWGVNVSGIITGLGVVGVVAGLAIQDALKDIIMGCNIIMDNYFVVGDVVKYGEFTGEVIDFSLKQTKIKNAEGIVLVVANRNIYEIQNLSQKNAELLIKVPTSYNDKQDKVEKVLKEICGIISKSEMSIEECEFLGIDSFDDSSISYLIRAHTTASNRWNYKREILGIIRKEFDKNHVEIPFNQIVVHNE